MRYFLTGVVSLVVSGCATCHHVDPADAGTDAGLDAGVDAGPDAGPIRTATTRALLPTPVNNILLDPFSTADQSLGHFLGVSNSCNPLTREFLSLSPAGISGPAIEISGAKCTRLLAEFTGGSPDGGVSGVGSRFNAQIWVSISDVNGQPVPFPASATDVEVSLISNALPDAGPGPVFTLDMPGTATQTIAGRQWALFALAQPVELPMGGWFQIVLGNTAESFYFQAPQVVPTEAVALAPPRQRKLNDEDRAAIAEHERIVRIHQR